MALITGSKYSGTISNYSTLTRQIVITGATFVLSDFNVPRMIVACNSLDEFVGLAIVRRFINSTTLELESDFFDPITQLTVNVSGGGFEISNRGCPR